MNPRTKYYIINKSPVKSEGGRAMRISLYVVDDTIKFQYKNKGTNI